MTWIYLVLIAVVILFGVGVLVWSRRRGGGGAAPLPEAPPRRIDKPPTAPPPAGGAPPTVVLDRPPIAVVEPPAPQVEAPAPEVEVPVRPVPPPSLRSRMARARAALAGVLTGVRGRDGITAETWDDLEEALLVADVGIGVTTELLAGLRDQVKAKTITTPDELLAALQAEMKGRLAGSDRELHFDPAARPNVWLFVGVNGVGKTTSIGKVASQQALDGRSVLMAAGDTFRAAATEQLSTWAERSGAELVRGNSGGDPSAVVFDAIERAASRSIDLVLADTAGRLHTKTNLMEELRKVRRVAEKGAGTVTEALLVIDATTGQNGLAQAREFGDATALTGVVLTKLDGSAKGGIVFAIETELGIPVKLVGLGETVADLAPFDPDEFVDALF
jgi:fused signal recognition particle receptor